MSRWFPPLHVPGFRPLGEFESWHQGSGHWVEADLSAGERPLLVGEIPQKGDLVWVHGCGPWGALDSSSVNPVGVAHTKCKTTRPLPLTQEELHTLLADKARLDWLDKQGSGQPWIARQSALGRGYRLHNFRDGEFKDGGETVRAAIDAAMKQEEAV